MVDPLDGGGEAMNDPALCKHSHTVPYATPAVLPTVFGSHWGWQYVRAPKRKGVQPPTLVRCLDCGLVGEPGRR